MSQTYKGLEYFIAYDPDPAPPWEMADPALTVFAPRSPIRFGNFVPHPDPDPEIVAQSPLYLYSHSGYRVSTCPFDCRWDSGQIGICYYTREQLKTMGHGRITKKLVGECYGWIESTVKQWDKYLSGEVYAASVPQLEDSCSDFYSEEDALNWVKEVIDYHLSPESLPLWRAAKTRK